MNKFNRYPSPCEKCALDENGCNYKKCNAWVTRYLYRQKQINAYAKRVLPDYYERQHKWRAEYGKAD